MGAAGASVTRTILASTVVVAMALAAWAEEPTSRPAAAESLTHSAQDLVVTPGAPARAARVIVLTDMAVSMDGASVLAQRMQADIRRSQERHAQAADAMKACLALVPHDQIFWREWLLERITAIQTADGRRAFLDQVVKDDRAPASIRAQALVRYADILAGQGQTDKAGELFLAALRFDPYQPEALRGWLGIQTEPVGAPDRCNMLLRILRASPLDTASATDLALLLGTMGLRDQALEVFDVVHQVLARQEHADQVNPVWLVHYGNAMLDAGQPRRVVDLFAPFLESHATSLDMRVLLIEAYRALSEPGHVRDQIRQIEAAYVPTPAVQTAMQYDIDMAMFYLTTHPDGDRALHHARRVAEAAGEAGAKDPIVQRLIGGAELANDVVEQGLARLGVVKANDAYAAFFVARYAFDAGRMALAKRALAAGLGRGRTGPAYRMLAMLARGHDVAIEPMPGMRQVMEQLSTFGDMPLKMALHPEQFLRVQLDAPPVVLPGQAVTVSATIENISPVDVPIGPTGLCSPVLALSVAVTDDGGDVFADVPMLLWHAPKYLAPAQSLTASARVDVGEVADFMARRAFEDIRLRVRGVLDPVGRDGVVTSALPTVEVAPVAMVRRSLASQTAAALDAQALTEALAAGLADADLDVRLQTVRQIGQALTTVGDPRGNSALPAGLMRETTHDLLMSLATKALADDDPAVRAEMLAAVQTADVTDRLLLATVARKDASPLVRLRKAELIGLSTQAPNDVSLIALSRDEDPLVARMAEAMLKALRAADAPSTQPADAPQP